MSDEGWVRSYTDELGNATTYDYDDLGRLTRIVHPAGDTVAWANTTISFAPQDASPFNLPSNLWKQSVTTGNYAKETYFDALWRPLLVRERDVSAATSDRLRCTDSTPTAAGCSRPIRSRRCRTTPPSPSARTRPSTSSAACTRPPSIPGPSTVR
ncbi:MAG: RHS repeat protein [Xanthomonadales bacterium]|nr:RHS repeat protein [Xanthomonadales bacterium]